MKVVRLISKSLLFLIILIKIPHAYEADISISRDVARINFKQIGAYIDNQTIGFHELLKTKKINNDQTTGTFINAWFTQHSNQIYYQKQRIPNINLNNLILYMQDHFAYHAFMEKPTNDVGIYATDDQQGYYFSSTGITYLVDIDLKSFTPLNHVYAKDKNYVYFKGKRIKNADSQNFQILDASWGHRIDRQHYAKDLSNVYVRGKILDKANPNTFKFYTELGFSYDDQHVFFEDQIIENSDGASFEVLSEMASSTGALYARDKNQAYYGNKILTKADPKTLTAITLEIAKDHQYVYDRGEIMPNIDSQSFEIIGPGNSPFLKDKNYVYSIIYDHEPNTLKTLKHIDPETAEFGHYTFVKDKNGCYRVNGNKHNSCRR